MRVLNHEVVAIGFVRAHDTMPRRYGSRAPAVFLWDVRMRRLGTASVLGSVPAALISPTAELCLAGQPHSRHLLGSLVSGLLMGSPQEIRPAQVT